MATSSPRITLVTPLCPNQSSVLQITDILGGGGIPSNYYVSWFKKNVTAGSSTYPKPSFCPGFGVAGHTRKVTIDLKDFDWTCTTFNIPQFVATPVVYLGSLITKAAATALILADLVGYGRIINSNTDTIEVLLLPTDPDYNNVNPFVNFSASGGSDTITTFEATLTCTYTTPAPTPNGYDYITGGIGYNILAVNSPGIYVCQVTDGSNTTNEAIFEIFPEQIESCLIKKKDITCFGKDDGEACVDKSTILDDSGDYRFEWSVPQLSPTLQCFDESDNPIACDLSLIPTTDPTGCWKRVIIPTYCPNDPAPTDPVCIDINNNVISCPTPNPADPGCYLIQYIPILCPGRTVISTEECIKNLSAGTYCLTIINNNGCKRTCCVTISEPAPLALMQISLTQPNCSDSCTQLGEAVYEVTGGTTEPCLSCAQSPYRYWLDTDINTIRAQNDSGTLVDIDNLIVLRNLTAGTHKLTVKDCNCCYTTVTFVIELSKTVVEL